MKVFVNGCFDILHRGHLEMLKFAKEAGGFLVVALDSDDKVVKDKGLSRPVNCQEDRKFMLESLRWVDEVRVFDTREELSGLVKQISPDLMIVGSDWRGKHIVGGEFAKEIRYFDRVGTYSTSNIIESFAHR
jgi:D-beta-D-heptose 7-phosphate kinase/D-beta-D-heptose 1-phosphate adenosyltransferase